MRTRANFGQPSLTLLLVSLRLAVEGAPLSIDYPPREQSVILHQPAAFGVIAGGTAPFSYQWLKDAMPISGATNQEFVIAHAQFSDAGVYSALVSNRDNTVSSADAVLTVKAPAGGDLDYDFDIGSTMQSRQRVSEGIVRGQLRGSIARHTIRWKAADWWRLWHS